MPLVKTIKYVLCAFLFISFSWSLIVLSSRISHINDELALKMNSTTPEHEDSHEKNVRIGRLEDAARTAKGVQFLISSLIAIGNALFIVFAGKEIYYATVLATTVVTFATIIEFFRGVHLLVLWPDCLVSPIAIAFCVLLCKKRKEPIQ